MDSTNKGNKRGTESQGSRSGADNDTTRAVELPPMWRAADSSTDALASIFHKDKKSVNDVVVGLRSSEFLFCSGGEWYLYSVPTGEGWQVMEPKGKQALLDQLAGERGGLQLELVETYDD